MSEFYKKCHSELMFVIALHKSTLGKALYVKYDLSMVRT